MTSNRSFARIGTVAGSLTAAILLTITQSSAVSAENERATDPDGPDKVNSWVCTGTDTTGDAAADVCYSDLGDWIQVYDGAADGSSAVMDWEVRDGGNNVVRFGATFNADGEAAERYKNKDFPESDQLRFRACLGHWSTKLITAGTCGPWRYAYV
ncbi:hypothetical protein ACIRRT_34230 [Streptomyces sp. NPDC102256]|uniref:hypothetical protein n=1 Tax=Streptomyces sp. NPDC102256 TaxID=3366147 RepID=UPI003814E729